MKLRNIFLIVFIFALFSGMLLSYNHTTKTIPLAFEKEVGEYLNSNIQSRAERINDNFLEIEQDVLFLANSPRIKNMLKEELENSDRAAKLMVDSTVDIISKEIENYILIHPKMTLGDLQESLEFQNIVVQEFGVGGYSLLIGKNSEIIYFHQNPELIGIYAKDASGPNIGTYLLLNESINEGYSSGYYNWIDENKNTRRKYGSFKKIDIKTADDISFIIEVTAYVDKFNVIKNLSKKDDKFLKDFIKINNYDNLLLYDKVGYITYMTHESLDFGLNLKLVEGGIYEEALRIIKKDKTEEALFKGLFLIDDNIFISIAISVYDGNEFLGMIAIHKKMNDINEILKSSIYIGETENNYIMDLNKMLITPLSDGIITPFVQEINTEGASECADDFYVAKKMNITSKEFQKFEIESGIEDPYLKYLDYKGDLVFGQHFPLEKTGWCLLSEIGVEEVLEVPEKTDIRREFKLQGTVFLASILIFILFYFLINKKYYIKEKKWEGFSVKFLNKISNKKIFLISSIFSILLLTLIYIFIFGYNNAIAYIFSKGFLLFMAQIIFIGLSISIILYSNNAKNKNGKWLFLGGILFIIYNILSIITFFSFEMDVNLILEFWNFGTIFKLLGFLSLLAYFMEELK